MAWEPAVLKRNLKRKHEGHDKRETSIISPRSLQREGKMSRAMIVSSHQPPPQSHTVLRHIPLCRIHSGCKLMMGKCGPLDYYPTEDQFPYHYIWLANAFLIGKLRELNRTNRLEGTGVVLIERCQWARHPLA